MYNNTVEEMKVPKKWYGHLQSIKQSKQDFDDKYLNQDGVKKSSIIEGDEYHGGKKGYKIELVIYEGEYQGERPDEYQGHDVVIKESKRDEVKKQEAKKDQVNGGDTSIQLDHSGGECYYNDHNWTNYYGGIPFWRQHPSNRTEEFPKGTHSWVVEYNGNRYIQGARHSYVTCGSYQSPSDEEVYTEEYKIGDVVDWDHSVDAFIATMDAQDFLESSPQIVNESGTDAWPVGGIHSETSIAEMILLDEQYTAVGTSTGRRYGFVEAQYESYNEDCDQDGYGVRGTAEVASGDSGSPAFTVEGGDAMLLSIRTHLEGTAEWHFDCPYGYIWSESVGTAAHRLRDIGYKPVTY